MLLSGDPLQKAVTRIMKGEQVSCAVAFWGRGAAELIGTRRGRNVKLICNLRMGGTNPSEIDEIMAKSGVEVRQNDTLHAKVYIGDDDAVVSSANASINGLGLEGNELNGWIEAGVVIPAESARAWFEDLWDKSRGISAADIANAKIVFLNRRNARPTRPFKQFDPEAEDLPLVCWVGNDDYEDNVDDITNQLGKYNKEIADRILNGIDIEGPDDRNIRSGTWILYWMITDQGLPNRTQHPWWSCASGVVVENAITYEGDESATSVMLRMEVMPPEPFDLKDPLVRKALITVLSGAEFGELRSTDYEGSFFASRQQLMRNFWRKAHEEYLRLLPTQR